MRLYTDYKGDEIKLYTEYKGDELFQALDVFCPHCASNKHIQVDSLNWYGSVKTRDDLEKIQCKTTEILMGFRCTKCRFQFTVNILLNPKGRGDNED